MELIKKLRNVSWDMWEHQNSMLHNSLQPCDNILASRINKQLKALYNQGLQAMPQDVFVLFQKSLKDLLQQPWNYKEKWVASVEAAQERKRYHDLEPISRNNSL